MDRVLTPGHTHISDPPLQRFQPTTQVQFGLGAILPHSNTPARDASRSDAGGPSLRVAGFEDEDDDEDEYEAPFS